jgi:hypothetical protein
MKRNTMHMILAAAALMLAVGTASAQSMKAEIPFAFRVGNQLMQPGEYHFRLLPSYSGAVVWRLTSDDSNSVRLAVPFARADASKEWLAAGAAKLSFNCADSSCSLNRIWSGEGDAYVFRTPHGKNGDSHIAEIIMRPERAD